LVFRLAALALVLIGLASPAGAWCDPNIDRSVRGEFHQSDYVVSVSVSKVTWLDEKRRPTRLEGHLAFGDMPGGLDPYIGAYYSVTRIENFKGNLPQRFRIFSENTTGRTPLQVGKRYLLFLTRQDKSDEYVRAGDLMGDSCGNGRQLSYAGPMLPVLRRLARSSSRPR
jgi:hypothetical protein